MLLFLYNLVARVFVKNIHSRIDIISSVPWECDDPPSFMRTLGRGHKLVQDMESHT